METLAETTASSRKRGQKLSADGQWRSFSNVPNLLQYVGSGNYYGRIKVRGKVIRESLETQVWTTAKLRLADFLKRQHEARAVIPTPTYAEAAAHFRAALKSDNTIKPGTREYRLLCLDKIDSTWPALSNLRIAEITDKACRDWAAGLRDKLSAHYFNNTIGTLRMVIDAGIKAHKGQGGTPLENPAAALGRTKVRQRELKLPEPSQFKDLVANIRAGSGGYAERVGDLVEFLAYGGMRIYSEAAWVHWEDVNWKRGEIVVRGDPETATKNSEMRRVPIIADMETLLRKMERREGEKPKGKILQVNECHLSLRRACRELGLAPLTHHDLRHLFATRCIESGVDIPTVSRWLGHKDGGALAMKTYGHLRNEHSRNMAAKVKF